LHIFEILNEFGLHEVVLICFQYMMLQMLLIASFDS
jgi:hypothetical protein